MVLEVNKSMGESSLDLKWPSESTGRFSEGACGKLGSALHVAQYASLNSGSNGSGFINPILFFSKDSASSNSPAATRSHTSLRFRNHFVWSVSPMVRLAPFSSTTASSTTSPPRSKSSMSPQSAPTATGPPVGLLRSSPQPPPISVSSGTSEASTKGVSWLADTFSKVVFSKICFTDLRSGQFASSPLSAGLTNGTGGMSKRAFGGMAAEMSLPCNCSSSLSRNSVRPCDLAVRAASGTWPISAKILTRSSTAPSINALLNRDITSFLISAIFNIFLSFVVFPVIR
mmetsp:Transcript_33512/g.95343  ORF Transcript_33512/g.95343 Transcript_33512/m.95343 type:complete len:286 (+) Transcript_33512:770-1627(+)